MLISFCMALQSIYTEIPNHFSGIKAQLKVSKISLPSSY